MRALAGWLYIYLAFICTRRVDPDYGWHWRSGYYILTHGVPHSDVFTYTASAFPWINHEWLNDVLVYAVAHVGGYFVLGLLFAAIWCSALIIALWRVRPQWTVAGPALGALLLYVGVRPVAWTALGLALVLRILAAEPRRYWMLVPLFGLWANLHAGFAAGLALVAVKVALDRSMRLVRWGALAAAATLINPFGFGIYVELWRTMTDGRLSSQIVEWGPLAMNRAVAPYVVVSVVALIAWTKWDFARVSGAALTAAALWSGRQVPLMVVGTLALVSKQVSRSWGLMRGRVAKWVRLGAGTFAGVVFPVALLVWPPQVERGLTLARPTQEVAALKSSPCAGHLFNDYNYGGYLISTLPSVPVYIDGRMPSWSGPHGRYLDIYARVLEGGPFADKEFDRFAIRCALISKYDDKLSAHLAKTAPWHREVKGTDAELWRRD